MRECTIPIQIIDLYVGCGDNEKEKNGDISVSTIKMSESFQTLADSCFCIFVLDVLRFDDYAIVQKRKIAMFVLPVKLVNARVNLSDLSSVSSAYLDSA